MNQQQAKLQSDISDHQRILDWIDKESRAGGNTSKIRRASKDAVKLAEEIRRQKEQ